MHRRDFFDLSRLARTAGQIVGAVEETKAALAEACEPDEGDLSLVHFSRRAMACTFELLIPFGIPEALPAAEAALDEVDRLETQLSVFRDDSEVSELNRRAASEAVRVEPRLYELLKTAVRISAEMDGAYDITTGALIKAWGFFKRAARLPTIEERRAALAQVGSSHFEFDDAEQTIRYLRPGLEINLGSIGKGYALDRVGELLRKDRKIPAALLHGGNSSVYAMGTDPRHTRGWAVGVNHPWDAARRLAVVRLRDRSLATSGATYQHLEHNGRRLGHLLDPRTGWPAEGMASATVIAPTAAEADALSTAFFVAGVDKARSYCARHAEIGAVLLPEGEDARPVVLGLDADDIQLAPP